MKATATMDNDNWLNVTVEAETPAEASQLTQLAMARNAATDKVANFYLGKDGVTSHITLRPRKDMWNSSIKPSWIPKVK